MVVFAGGRASIGKAKCGCWSFVNVLHLTWVLFCDDCELCIFVHFSVFFLMFHNKKTEVLKD